MLSVDYGAVCYCKYDQELCHSLKIPIKKGYTSLTAPFD